MVETRPRFDRSSTFSPPREAPPMQDDDATPHDPVENRNDAQGPPPEFHYPSPDAVYHTITIRAHELADHKYGFDTADEVASKVMHTVWRKRQADPNCLTTKSEIVPYVETALHDKLIDAGRAEKAKDRRHVALEPEMPNEPAAVAQEAAADRERIAKAFDAALSDLELEFRLPLMLAMERGKTHKEIAELLGTSERTMDRTMAEARFAFGKALKAHGLGAELAGRFLYTQAIRRNQSKGRES
jgi:RNA polymerase sigma factor (sigma-70 family)